MHWPFIGHSAIPDSDPSERIEVNPASINQPEAANQITDLEQRLELAKSANETLHRSIQLFLSTSGFLLTICLGAIYFSYNNSAVVKLPLLTMVCLFLSAFLLAVAVLRSVHPLHLPDRPSYIGGDLAETLESTYDDEKPYADDASYLLERAVWMLLLGIVVFAIQRFWVSLNSGDVSGYVHELENISNITVTITRRS
jgi:hypothetical protein